MEIGEWISTTASGVGLVNGIAQTAKSVLELFKKKGDATEREQELKERVQDLYSQALDVKAEYLKLRDQCLEFEQEIKRLRQFVDESSKYELRETYTNSFAYALKVSPGEPSSVPAHFLCANCFERAERSILQQQQHLSGRNKLSCTRCGATVYVTAPDDPPRVTYGRVRKSRTWGDF